jgi:hypothetical protein
MVREVVMEHSGVAVVAVVVQLVVVFWVEKVVMAVQDIVRSTRGK